MSRIRRSLSFSNVVALMALFFALGGSAYAVAAAKIDGSQIAASSIPARRATSTYTTETRPAGSRAARARSCGRRDERGRKEQQL